MYIELTAEQQALRTEIREYFAKVKRPGIGQRDLAHPEYSEVLRELGEDGWLGISWPKEYGGQARSSMDLHIFFDEATRADMPFPMLSVMAVGPALIQWGTEEQKARFLPKILRGELQFAIGYSEPDAGTDLASLKTRAHREGDEWVINGQKLWTSGAEAYDYVWLACRTDPESKKHRGLSILMVPLDSPGLTVHPIPTLSERTNATFYDNVRVPSENLVGVEGEGWNLIMSQLNHERVFIGHVGGLEVHLEEVCDWARATKTAEGKRVIDQEWVQLSLARVAAKLEFLRLRNHCTAWETTAGILNPTSASVTKVFSSQFYLEAYGLLLEVVGQSGYLTAGSDGAVLRGELEKGARANLLLTFGGGTNEIQRDIIGMMGLGLPRAPR
jgi:alkylation response protein AidB-like acyl-CoA dehydrogenase